MTIAVNIGASFNIETYDGLIAYVIAHLELDAESATQVPTFIRNAEYRLDRLLPVAQRETSVALIASAGLSVVPLPSDLRSVEAIEGLRQMALSQLLEKYADCSGEPLFYAIGNQQLVLGPVPASDTTLNVTYLTRLPALSSTNQTNWLLTANADAYVYATLMQAAGWLEDLDAATVFKSELLSIIDEINLQASEYRAGTPMVPNLGFVV